MVAPGWNESDGNELLRRVPKWTQSITGVGVVWHGLVTGGYACEVGLRFGVPSLNASGSGGRGGTQRPRRAVRPARGQDGVNVNSSSGNPAHLSGGSDSALYRWPRTRDLFFELLTVQSNAEVLAQRHTELHAALQGRRLPTALPQYLSPYRPDGSIDPLSRERRRHNPALTGAHVDALDEYFRHLSDLRGAIERARAAADAAASEMDGDKGALECPSVKVRASLGQLGGALVPRCVGNTWIDPEHWVFDIAYKGYGQRVTNALSPIIEWVEELRGPAHQLRVGAEQGAKTNEPGDSNPQPKTVAVDASSSKTAAEPWGDLASREAEASKGTAQASGVIRTDTDWRIVQGQLLRKRDLGEPYTSLRTLSRELGCCDATIRKAIDESDTLKGWKARSAGAKAAPKAADLGAVARGRTHQTTEPAPHDVLPADDVDATMSRLIGQAKPAERARLNALDDAGRRALVAAYQAQNLDDEPSPLRLDEHGKRSRQVMQHKRA